MKHRIKLETTHPELFKILLNVIVKEMTELGVPPITNQKVTKSSRTVELTANITARESLENTKDEDGRTKLKYQMGKELKNMFK